MARSAKTRTESAGMPAGPADDPPVTDAEVIAETPPAPAGEGQAGSAGGPTLAASAPPAPAMPAKAAAAPVTVRRVGFVPVVLGGAVAAGLGFAAGWQGLLPMPGGSETEGALSAQAARIGEVEAALAALPDTAPLAAGIEALRADLGPLAERIATLEARLDTVERAPAGDGTLSEAAVAAWQRDIAGLKDVLAAQRDEIATMGAALAAREADLAGLREAMAAQRAEVARMADEAAARLDAAQTAMAGIEQQATASATATLQRAVLANLRTAVDEGRPFADLVAEFAATGAAVPPALSAAATGGVATLAALSDSFPEAARAALAAARAEGVADDGGSGVMAFLRRQLDVRSVEPREGDDPDAILSRAEAALREARLTDALAEVMALPETVRAPMGAWIAAAETRMAVLSGLQALAETLPSPDTSN